MLKKEEVYVRVSSEKKARKLKEFLEMFNEKTFSDVYGVEFVECVGHVVHFVDCGYFARGFNVENKTKVTLKELRNILAIEKLREGDIVVCKDGDEIALGVFKEWESQFGFDLDNVYYTNDPDCNSQGNGGCFVNFIRYATEEEKSLLEPKKELEVGKWYKTDNALFNHQKGYNSYGFLMGKWENSSGGWRTNREDWVNCGEITEATQQEVEEALIKEAKRRYKVGDKLSKLYDDCYKGDRIFSLNLSHQVGLCDLWIDDDNGYSSCVFKNGKWAEVIKPEKSLEELRNILAREKQPEESVIDKAISLLQHGLGLDYSHEVIQGLEELKNK